MKVFEEIALVNDLLAELERTRKTIVAHPQKLDEKVSVSGHEFTFRELLQAGHFRIVERTWMNPSEMYILNAELGTPDDSL